MADVPPHTNGAPPPRPPPHNPNAKSPKGASGLPAGNYDIFIVPPHSAGGGFLYLPSLKPQVNSFVAGVVCTLAVVYAWFLIQPIVKAWIQAVSQSGSGFGIVVLVFVVAFISWATAKTSVPATEGASGFKPNGSPPHNGYANGNAGSAGPDGQWGSKHTPNNSHSGPQSPEFGAQGAQGQSGPGFGSPPNGQYRYPFEDSPPGSQRVPTPEPYPADSPTGGTYKNQQSSTAWEKAREETRKREEERKRQEDLKRRQEEEKRKRDTLDREARAAAEKERWEQQRAREKETRERELREKLARERMAKSSSSAADRESKDIADRAARVKAAADRAEQLRAERASEKANTERAKSEKAIPTFGVGERLNPYSREHPGPKSTIGTGNRKPGSPTKPYQHPTAQTYVGTATETGFRPYETSPKTAPHGSYYAASTSSHTDTQSTAPTSAPSSYSGPYTTKDPEKVMIHGAFKFNDNFPNTPLASVRPGESKITDGLIMRFNTEGIFLDDDRTHEQLRSWDIKAWTLTAIETADKPNYTLFRASIMSQEKIKYVYVVPAAEKWKVDAGLKRLKSGSLYKRSTTVSVMSNADANKLIGMMGI